MLALPGLFLILLFLIVFGRDTQVVCVRPGLIGDTRPLVRIARASTLSTLTNPYVESAEVMGGVHGYGSCCATSCPTLLPRSA